MIELNISNHFKRMANSQPYKKAVVSPNGRDKNGRIMYSHLTFRQLDRESDRVAYGLEKVGIVRGTRTVLMVKPGIDFFIITFALFKTGAVPVVVDPGMGISRMIQCLKKSSPSAFIGIPLAHVLRFRYPKFFNKIKTFITVGRRWLWSGFTIKGVASSPWRPYLPVKTDRDETAAILFTTGSTGPAKGVVYTHGIFYSQIKTIQKHFNITADEIDLPTFPLFALFDPVLGMTAVIPDMDPTKPAHVNPRKIFEAIVNQGVTNMFASPALLNRVGKYGKNRNLKLPSLKRVVSAGAPVSPHNIEQFASMLCDGTQIHTPYGATEAMPVVSIGSVEILTETKKLTQQGYGTCIGRSINSIQVRIIKINDHPIRVWKEDLLVQEGEIGELVVKGKLVTRQYFEDSRANDHSKIRDKNSMWHRMGDLGWRDKKGRIWFCGRKSHRVITKHGTLFTIPCESIFNNHKDVFRSALVGVGESPNQKPVICIELESSRQSDNKEKIEKELLKIASQHEITRFITTILFHKSFPVDIRHNSKIFREKLGKWAKKKMKVKKI